MARPKTKVIPKFNLLPHRIKTFFALLDNFPKVEVEGLGTFQIVHIKQKKTFHNFSGRVRVIKAYNRLKFTQSPELKGKLRGLEAIKAEFAKRKK